MQTIKHTQRQAAPRSFDAVRHLTPRGRPVWSHSCTWDELAVFFALPASARSELDLAPGWMERWTTTCRFDGVEVTHPLRELAEMSTSGWEPVRRFSWRTRQRHRPGLQYLVSTGRHHGFESLEEARLLLALDFAAGMLDLVSQPFRMRFSTRAGWRAHTPDFFVLTAAGTWLLDVRPEGRVEEDDVPGFVATAEAALACGWRYGVVTGWRAHVRTTLDTLSSQRRRLSDPLLVQTSLLRAAALGPRPFGELVEATAVPPVARAHLLHLLWQRRLGIDLGAPLNDATLVQHVRGSST
jgi:hypothetical protein